MLLLNDFERLGEPFAIRHVKKSRALYFRTGVQDHNKNLVNRYRKQGRLIMGEVQVGNIRSAYEARGSDHPVINW